MTIRNLRGDGDPLMTTYTGEYPVPSEWVDQHLEDEQVSFRYVMSLDDLIEANGIEDMNDFLDSVLDMKHATLTDISYRFADPEWDEFDPQNVLIEATGVLESF